MNPVSHPQPMFGAKKTNLTHAALLATALIAGAGSVASLDTFNPASEYTSVEEKQNQLLPVSQTDPESFNRHFLGALAAAVSIGAAAALRHLQKKQ